MQAIRSQRQVAAEVFASHVRRMSCGFQKRFKNNDLPPFHDHISCYFSISQRDWNHKKLFPIHRKVVSKGSGGDIISVLRVKRSIQTGGGLSTGQRNKFLALGVRV